MASLTTLRRKLQHRLRQRDRQQSRWKRTRRRGHARAAKRHAKAVRYLRKLIAKQPAPTRIVSRSEWGAASPRGGYTRQGALIAGVQHHTAMPALSPDATFDEECARMRQLQAIHLGQGWSDIGYALVVFPSGRVYEGRPAWAVGAHTLGHNTGYAGWAADGNYDVERPTDALLEGCREARVALGVAGKPLYGHHELGPTACPGKYLKPHLRKEI